MTHDHVPREQEMARLSRLYTDLAHLGVEPPFSMEALQGFSDRRLHQAVKITQDLLLRVTKVMTEQ